MRNCRHEPLRKKKIIICSKCGEILAEVKEETATPKSIKYRKFGKFTVRGKGDI